MGFKDKRRKGINIKDFENADSARNVVRVNVPERMEINFNGQTARFKRLRYLGCPTVKPCGNKDFKISKNELILLNRDGFVREMYELFRGYTTKSETGYGRFCFLCSYVAHWDKRDHQVKFTEDEVLTYFKYRDDLVSRGKFNKNTLVKERQHLVSILNELGKAAVAVQIPKIRNRRQAAIPTEAIADKSYAILGITLMKAYQAYVECIFNGKPPISCPFFDKEMAIANGLTQDEIIKNRRLNYLEQDAQWTNALSKLALLITSKWTGGNLSPLISLTQGDARVIKKFSGDQYKFDSVKARALYERQELGIGFTKRSKEFIESWLIVADLISSGVDAPLFPLLDKNGNLSCKKSAYSNPHLRFNPKLEAMGLPPITIRKLRSTRSSVIQRAFENIFITAAANRNTIETTHNHYLEGVKENHEIELAYAFQVQKALTEGKEKNRVIAEFKEKIRDPFTSDEWLEKRKNSTANKTPNGARCTAPKGNVAKKNLKAIKALNLGGDQECISFLQCFDCSKHALIASADDIWLMLSFKDSLLETISRPAINNIPDSKFSNLIEKTMYILSRMEKISPEDYRVANEKNKVAPHPLYQEESDLKDLLEVYAL